MIFFKKIGNGVNAVSLTATLSHLLSPLSLSLFNPLCFIPDKEMVEARVQVKDSFAVNAIKLRKECEGE